MPAHHPYRRIPFGADNFLSVLEGIEGGFAIFVGIIAGLMFQEISYNLLIMTAAIGIIVNAFNASAVRYTSEHYIDELDGHEKRSWLRAYFIPSFIEFVTYLLVSAVAVLPLILVDDRHLALWLCILLTAAILFAAGAYRGKLLGRHVLRDAVEVALSGLLIVAVGAFSGWVLSHLLV
jgi:VIT1/CCC1 family predicted Fe2+/Mn2+ transporter